MTSRQQRRAGARRGARRDARSPGFDARRAVQLADLAVPHVERLIAEGHAPEGITAAVSRVRGQVLAAAAPTATAADAARDVGSDLGQRATEAAPVPGATWCLVSDDGEVALVLLMRDVITAPGGAA